MSGDANPIDRRPLVEWFGYDHDMHDAEVQTIQLLHPPGVSVVRIRAFRMTPEVDDRGYYVLDRHAIVSFRLEGLKSAQVENWEFCTTLANVEWELSGGLHRLTLVSVMDGSEAVFSAEKVIVSVEALDV